MKLPRVRQPTARPCDCGRLANQHQPSSTRPPAVQAAQAGQGRMSMAISATSRVTAALAGITSWTATAISSTRPARLGRAARAIIPEDAACHTDFELVSRSGAVAPVSLISDGQHVALRFTRQGVPSQAFLPIRIDQKPFANLVQRTGEEGLAVMGLSDETLAALKRGKTLQIAWLSDEAMSGSIAGAAQGIADLRTCGAQVAAQRRARDMELEIQRAHAAADSRAKALADEQLAAARAQTAAAEAATRKAGAEADA